MIRENFSLVNDVVKWKISPDIIRNLRLRRTSVKNKYRIEIVITSD